MCGTESRSTQYSRWWRCKSRGAGLREELKYFSFLKNWASYVVWFSKYDPWTTITGTHRWDLIMGAVLRTHPMILIRDSGAETRHQKTLLRKLLFRALRVILVRTEAPAPRVWPDVQKMELCGFYRFFHYLELI